MAALDSIAEQDAVARTSELTSEGTCTVLPRLQCFPWPEMLHSRGEDAHALISAGQDRDLIVSPFLRSCHLQYAEANGRSRFATIVSREVEETTADQTIVLLQGHWGSPNRLRFTARVTCYSAAGLARLAITIHNPQRARHPDGYWDLGDPGSILLKDLSLEIEVATNDRCEIEWRERREGPVQQTSGDHFEIYQESSGGEQWQSRNHVNRNGEIPLRWRGYRVTTAEGETTGERASPVVALRWEQVYVACAVEEFWEKFPTAIAAGRNHLSIRFWSDQSADYHELQAGERATRVVWLDFGSDPSQAFERFSQIDAPPQLPVDASWIAESGCISHFPSPEAMDRPELQSLLHEAIEGPRSFFAKREQIDEYGWRNFGDMWADHEQKYSDDPYPVISHYNNQYDLLHGLLVQYLRTGDVRWWRLADPLARHVMDIDIYHTDRDRPGYNGGLFWHTAHYHDAGRSTHRSMSQSMRNKKQPAPGAGPCNEHNYTTGLLLYHQLTGSPEAKEAVLGLAEWVIAVDDGRQHWLGVASDAPTGNASSTVSPDYHGPGRGAGNSIQALLNGWLVSQDEKYLQYAIELIERTIHPHDDLAARQLDNAELRWSYPVYLQALARFLELTAERHDLSYIRAYVRESLLHYARWMADHERFYLDEPEKLEFPTETWAAQELRKGTTLLMAAEYTRGDEREKFQRRSIEMLDRAWGCLMSFDSRVCTRPLALILQQGYLETTLRERMQAPPEDEEPSQYDFGSPNVFISQKQAIKAALRSPRGWLSLMSCAVRPGRWLNLWRQTWLAERIRRLFA